MFSKCHYSMLPQIASDLSSDNATLLFGVRAQEQALAQGTAQLEAGQARLAAAEERLQAERAALTDQRAALVAEQAAASAWRADQAGALEELHSKDAELAARGVALEQRAAAREAPRSELVATLSSPSACDAARRPPPHDPHRNHTRAPSPPQDVVRSYGSIRRRERDT